MYFSTRESSKPMRGARFLQIIHVTKLIENEVHVNSDLHGFIFISYRGIEM